jgi:Domain of unknown function (DUF4912)
MANLLNLVKMTVSELRELARKYLGGGHSRLKTKSELIAALKQKVSDSRAKAVPAKTKSAPKTKPTRKKEAATRRSKRAPTARAARVSSGPPPVPDISALGTPPKASMPPKVLNEGFFVGAQVPTAIARPRSPIHLAPALPESYGSDDVVAIHRAPGALFVFWDFGEETILAAAQGLVDWRLVLRVYRGAEIVREVPVELVHGRAYLEDLPNDSARVELHAVGTNASRRIAGSNVPPSFQSDQPSLLRLADLAWDTPLQAARSGAVRVREPTAESVQAIRARVAGAAGSSSPLGPWGEQGEQVGGAAGAASPVAPWGAVRRRFALPSSR